MAIPKDFPWPDITLSYTSWLRTFGLYFLFSSVYYPFIKVTALVLYGKLSQIIFAKMAWYK